LRACVIGPLPPIPSNVTISPAPSTSGGGAGGSPMAPSSSTFGTPTSSLTGTGSSGALSAMGTLPELGPAVRQPSRFAPSCFGPDAAAAVGAWGGAAGTAGMVMVMGAAAAEAAALGTVGPGLAYQPMVHATLGAGGSGPPGGPLSMFGGNDVLAGAGAPCWAAGPMSAAMLEQQSGMYAPPDQYGVPLWLQAAQQAQHAAEPPHHHQQALANLFQIQRLRDQLKAAEDAELAHIAQAAQAEAAFVGHAQGLPAAPGLLGGAAALVGGGGAGSAAPGTPVCGDGGSLSGAFGPVPPQLMMGDGPASLQALLAQQAPGLQGHASNASGSVAGGYGSDCSGGAGSVADLSEGFKVLPAFWGSGALLPRGGAAPGAPPLQGAGQPSPWPPSAFGSKPAAQPPPVSAALRAPSVVETGPSMWPPLCTAPAPGGRVASLLLCSSPGLGAQHGGGSSNDLSAMTIRGPLMGEPVFAGLSALAPAFAVAAASGANTPTAQPSTPPKHRLQQAGGGGSPASATFALGVGDASLSTSQTLPCLPGPLEAAVQGGSPALQGLEECGARLLAQQGQAGAA
jgi:hypothetical protein